MPQPTSAGFVRSRTVLAAVACLSALAVLSLPSSAAAANSCDAGVVDKTWEGDVNSSWFTAGNWAPAGVPRRPARLHPGGDGQPAGDRDGFAEANSRSIESSQPIQVNSGTLTSPAPAARPRCFTTTSPSRPAPRLATPAL